MVRRVAEPGAERSSRAELTKFRDPKEQPPSATDDTLSSAAEISRPRAGGTGRVSGWQRMMVPFNGASIDLGERPPEYC